MYRENDCAKFRACIYACTCAPSRETVVIDGGGGSQGLELLFKMDTALPLEPPTCFLFMPSIGAKGWSVSILRRRQMPKATKLLCCTVQIFEIFGNEAFLVCSQLRQFVSEMIW